MKAKVTLPNLEIEVEGATQSDLFEAIAEVQEVFNEGKCGACESENIQYRVREVDGNKYYELICKDCGAVLAYGIMKNPKGRLFPKRKINNDGKPDSKNGKWDSKQRGWTKFERKQ